MKIRYASVTTLTAVLLAGCAVAPTSPAVTVLPGTGKTLDQFQADNGECQRYAGAQTAQSPGARSADPYDLQRRYDFAYVQCMYSHGHRVPVTGAYTTAPTSFIPPPSQAPAPKPPSQPSPAQ